MKTFKEELQQETKIALAARGTAKDPYERTLTAVKTMCKQAARRGQTRWEERLTAAPNPYTTDKDYTLMPDDPDLKEQYLERLRADLPGLDVNLFFGGVYLDVSWE